ncbi:MAG: extracellular solute-binding protein [Thermogemmatispora sp.]|uniref:ABC transporter substrate-binding protein n=1 Tax=Thermogemmatispora aurantia TaxID=2045279 RepID=A0A5J4K7J0_9CHLR|nr:MULTISPECIES: extracellular solute-binding protein [Thermogemmatispora]MBE3566437.1 extracellular solute-binding protein [Thermogemmatispora sp.]GER83052.1 ABC transporter substrate-binding protein [Thermogemmatispora aurantia]
MRQLPPLPGLGAKLEQGWSRRQVLAMLAGGTWSLLSSCISSNVSQPIMDTCVSQMALCSPTSVVGSSSPTQIFWYAEPDPKGIFKTLVDTFNALGFGVQVTLAAQGSSTDAYHQWLRQQLKAGRETPQIFSLDIIYTAEFAEQHWLVSLDELLCQSDSEQYLQTALTAASYPTSEGRLWALPLHSDVGLLFCRSDIPYAAGESLPPSSWKQLSAMAREAQAKQSVTGVLPGWGYLWQDARYEGLVCNALEVFSGYGAQLLAEDSGQQDKRPTYQVIVEHYRDQLEQALGDMVSWVQGPGAITPLQSLESTGGMWGLDEPLTIAHFNQGIAAFMRNWPYAYNQLDIRGLGSQAHTQRVAVYPLPGATRPCIGGWQVAINAHASPRERAAALTFARWLLCDSAQKALAGSQNYLPVLKEIYNDPGLQANVPFYSGLWQMIEERGQLRPRLAQYAQFSSAVQAAVYSALLGERHPAEAITQLGQQLHALLG